MEQSLINDTVRWLRTLHPLSIYLTLFLVAYLENIIPPIWGDTLVVFAGYLGAASVIQLLPVYVLTVIASVIGFMTVYWLGFHWGDKIEEEPGNFWLLRFIPLRYLEKVRRWMGRWGLWIVAANRFLSGARSVISLTAGISKTNIFYTIICSTISSLLWNALLLSLGYVVKQNWQIIGHYLSLYGWFIFGVILLFILIRIGIGYYKRSKN